MTATLPIKKRVSEDKNFDLKELIPAVIYGPKQDSVSVMVNRKEFEKMFKVVGESSVIELTGLEKTITTLVKDVTFAPIKGGIVHIDFYALEKGKEVVTHVPLHFIGESAAAKLGAVVNKVMHEVTVTCQPADLPTYLDIDLSLIDTVEAKITVSDIVCPKGVKINAEPAEVVALAEIIKEEIEPEVVVDIKDIPVEQKGKEEEVVA